MFKILTLHQVYITAGITTALTTLITGSILYMKTPADERKIIFLIFFIELPMAFAAYYLVRMPLLDTGVKFLLEGHQKVYGFTRIFYAPLTEEPFKLLPLLIPFIRRKVTENNFWRFGLSLGLGFGIGEIWLVANFIGGVPAYSNLPWYQFTGFLNERFMVCVIHAGFTATALKFFHKRFYVGILLAMILHFFGNFPIYLSGINFGNFGKETWTGILSLWVPIYFIGMIVLIAYYAYGKRNAQQFFHAKVTCPECFTKYNPPLAGLNLINTRYEKCPNCRKWHWVTRWKNENI